MNAHDELMHSLGRIEQKLDTFGTLQSDDRIRLQSLERSRQYGRGFMAAVTACCAWFAKQHMGV